MLFKGVIIVAAIVLVVILWTVFAQEVSDSGLQDAIDECTGVIDNIGPSDRDLESCLDDAYNQYGSEKQKQSWFDDEH